MLKELPEITEGARKVEVAGSACFPAPCIEIEFLEKGGSVVGSVSLCKPQTNDCIYVFLIVVYDEYRECGYGAAMLQAIHNEFQLPIKPVDESSRDAAAAFWEQQRNEGGRWGFEVTPGVLSSSIKIKNEHLDAYDAAFIADLEKTLEKIVR